jgi:hypothetical protein
VQRFVRAKYPKPKLRVRRRVETPPGAQAQADWAEFPRMRVGGEAWRPHAFHLVLSHSRAEAIVWSERDGPAGLAPRAQRGAAPARRRAGRDARRQREDGDRHGRRALGQINEPTRPTRGRSRFHVDATRRGRPRRRARSSGASWRTSGASTPRREDWEERGGAAGVDGRARWRRAPAATCPATGTTACGSWEAELRLAPLPAAPRALRPGGAAARGDRRHGALRGPDLQRALRLRQPGGGGARLRETCRPGPTAASWPSTRAAPPSGSHRPAHYEGPSTERVWRSGAAGKMGRGSRRSGRSPRAAADRSLRGAGGGGAMTAANPTTRKAPRRPARWTSIARASGSRSSASCTRPSRSASTSPRR